MNDELLEFSHLWYGSENWGLSATYWTRVTLTAVFSGASPSVEELMALRRLRAEWRDVPVRELKARLEQHEVELGKFDGTEAREVEALAAQLRVPFSIRSEAESDTHYLPVQWSEKGEWMALIIEDEALEERVTSEMLRRGVPLVEILESD